MNKKEIDKFNDGIVAKINARQKAEALARWYKFRKGCPLRLHNACGRHGRPECKHPEDCGLWYAAEWRNQND